MGGTPKPSRGYSKQLQLHTWEADLGLSLHTVLGQRYQDQDFQTKSLGVDPARGNLGLPSPGGLLGRLPVSPKDHLQGHLNSCIHSLMRLPGQFVCSPFPPPIFPVSSSMPVFPAFVSNSRFRAAVLFCRQFSVIFLMPVLKRKADKMDG